MVKMIKALLDLIWNSIMQSQMWLACNGADPASRSYVKGKEMAYLKCYDELLKIYNEMNKSEDDGK